MQFYPIHFERFAIVPCFSVLVGRNQKLLRGQNKLSIFYRFAVLVYHAKLNLFFFLCNTLCRSFFILNQSGFILIVENSIIFYFFAGNGIVCGESNRFGKINFLFSGSNSSAHFNQTICVCRMRKRYF